MGKREYLKILRKIPKDVRIWVVVNVYRPQATRYIQLEASRPCFPAAWHRSGKTSSKILCACHRAESAARKADLFLRWTQEYLQGIRPTEVKRPKT